MFILTQTIRAKTVPHFFSQTEQRIDIWTLATCKYKAQHVTFLLIFAIKGIYKEEVLCKLHLQNSPIYLNILINLTLWASKKKKSNSTDTKQSIN